MSPSTTVNYADITIIPSRRILTALVILYSSAAFLLVFTSLTGGLPVSVVVTALWLLWHEAWHLAIQFCQKQGRLTISDQGNIAWQQGVWRLDDARIRTGWLILLRLQQDSQMCWLLIMPDSCHQMAYRSLALFAHHSDRIAD